MKKIALITTTQPAANPRLVKEADTFAAQGYDVTVLYCFVAYWAQEKDKFILKNALWKFKQLGGSSKSTSSYFFSAMKFSFYKFINKTFAGNLFAEQAHARCYSLLLREAIKLNADWYIGHNPGAMAVAANASNGRGAKAGFDFEDYHRGEYLDPNTNEFKRQIWLENKYLNCFSYLSAASSLIKEKIKYDYPALNIPFIKVLNCFSLKDQPRFNTQNVEDKNLKLFWFSQHIGKDRGLQIVCQALVSLNNPNINLTLGGNCTQEIKIYFKSLMGNLQSSIKFIGLISPDKLAIFSSKFDIGLAVEPGFSENNNLALSNKIFTYLLAGNAIIFSETVMQKEFNKNSKSGQSFPINDIETLKKKILFFMDKVELFKQKKHNYLLAQNKFNWENESEELLRIISN